MSPGSAAGRASRETALRTGDTRLEGRADRRWYEATRFLSSGVAGRRDPVPCAHDRCAAGRESAHLTAGEPPANGDADDQRVRCRRRALRAGRRRSVAGRFRLVHDHARASTTGSGEARLGWERLVRLRGRERPRRVRDDRIDALALLGRHTRRRCEHVGRPVSTRLRIREQAPSPAVPPGARARGGEREQLHPAADGPT